jgi:L-alanine-DL-glutamate epimerase-like enolase superfamily enzyme
VTIREVRIHRLVAPLRTPFVTALARLTTVSTVVVEIVDDDGRSGFGEAPKVWTVTGSSLASAEACISEVVRPLLIGRLAEDVIANCRAVSAAVVGNESAKASPCITGTSTAWPGSATGSTPRSWPMRRLSESPIWSR